MKTTFLINDVELLLKDITDIAVEFTVEQRELLIKAGSKAYEFVPLESIPSGEEILLYKKGIEISAEDTAMTVKNVAEMIYKIKGKKLVLVSLARGGVCAGILIKKYLLSKYKIDVPHYALTLIGTKGIDENALKYVLSRHQASDLQFVDGWTGKGAIIRTLKKSLINYKNVSTELAVLCDPANLTDICGTHKDILIASACLNAPISGLISRAVSTPKYLKDNDFFGAVFYDNLLGVDRTYDFIDKVVEKIDYSGKGEIVKKDTGINGLEDVKMIADDFDIEDIHFIKPGVGETMRALIRKKPDIILIKDKDDKYVEYIKEVAKEKNIVFKKYPLVRYAACGIYKDNNSDIL